MNPVYISREIQLAEDDCAGVLMLLFYLPVRWKTLYRCHYEIRLNDEVVHRSSAEGVDGVQAVLLAMASVVGDLEFRFPKLGARVPEEYLSALRTLK